MPDGGEAAYVFRLRRTAFDDPAACKTGCSVTFQIIKEHGVEYPDASLGANAAR